MREGFPLYVEWKIQEIDSYTQEVLYESNHKNLIVKNGRKLILQNILGLNASSVIALAAGACSTAATVNDTRLNYEHVLNGVRKTPLKNSSETTLIESNIIDDQVTIDTVTYYKACTVSQRYLSTDANNGALPGTPFQEYALMVDTRVPPLPTSELGIMLNHLVDVAPIYKHSTNEILVLITLRC